MKKLLSLLALGLGVALASAAHANDKPTITQPHARATVAGMTTSGAWFTVTNHGSEDDRIIAATASEVAGQTELHDMKMEGDIMRMFQIDGIDVPVGQTITLGQGNKLHVMLLNLKKQLKAGDHFPLTVQFEKAGSVTVEALVQEINSGGHGHHGHQH